MNNHSRDIEYLQHRWNRMKAWVACFSAGGVTARLAARLAEAITEPLYEIKPAVPYYQTGEEVVKPIHSMPD